MRWVAACAVVLAACGSSHDAADGGVDAPDVDAGPDVDAARAFLAAYRRLACENAATCPSGWTALFGETSVLALSPDACAAIDYDASGWGDAVSNGDATFDAEQAVRCLDALRAGACADPFMAVWYADPEACRAAFAHVVAGPGESCHGRACPTGQHCSGFCPSSCMDDPPPRTTCTTTSECTASLCIGGLCTPVMVGPAAPTGAPCGSVGALFVPCASPRDECPSGICTPLPGDGGACRADQECPTLDTCVDVIGTGTASCTHVVVVGEGASCATTPGAAVPVCDVRAGLLCDDDRTCHHVSGADGDRCDPIAGLACAPGSACQLDGRCHARIAGGGSCDLDAQCADGYVCRAGGYCAACATP